MVTKMSNKDKNPVDNKKLCSVGYTSSKKGRSGSFLIIDNDIINIESWNKRLEILPLSEAVERYLWLKNSKLISKNSLGYFIRVLHDVKINYPVQACFYMKENKSQTIHNILVAEENSEVHLISGCTASIGEGKHIGISEYYVKENALLSITRIHCWPSTTSVFSKGSTLVERNATFISNYVALTPAKKERSYSITRIKKNGVARFNSIVYAKKDSNFNIKDKVLLEEENARSEILSKAISNGGEVVTREHIQGIARNTRGHIECDGLLLGDKGKIHAIPELEAINPKTDLSHEAAVGKISEEEINYLMSRGIDEETAKSLIVHGFLDVKIKGLPKNLQKSIDKLIERISIEGTT